MSITVYPFWGGIMAGNLAPVATTGSYTDLYDRPALGSAAATEATAYATAAQGGLAATALQPSAIQGSATDETAGRLQRVDWLGQAPAILDSARRALERSSRGRNTILYNAGREEIHVVRIDACSYADLGSAYTAGMNGTGILEAFSAGGVAKTHLWVGKYPAALSASGRVVCQPGLDPWVDISYDEAVAACAALGTISGQSARLMSVWDWAAITHLIMASSRGQPTGNTDYGRHHTSKWQRATRVDGALGGVTTGTPRTLTGSGPREWSHDLSDFGIADLVGNVWEWLCGAKMTEGVISLGSDNGTVTTEASWAAQSGYTMPASGAWSSLSNAGASDALKRALIVPATGVTSPAGYLYTSLTGERLPVRGGRWNSAGDAGLAALNLGYARGNRGTTLGFRPAFAP